MAGARSWLLLFSMAVPLRGEFECGFPGSPAYGSVSPERAAYASGEAVTFQCRVGYILLGAPTARCGPGGLWSEQVPICDDSMTTLGVSFSTAAVSGHPSELAIDRRKDTCASLKPKKPRWWRIDLGQEHRVLSVAITMDPDKDVKFTVFVIKTQGTSASYKRCASFSGKFGTQTVVLSCAEGKGIEGQKVHIEDHHQTEGFFDICEVEVQVEKDTGYDCGKPSRSLNSVTDEPNRGEVNYGCLRGYELIGRDSRTCESTGQWSGNPPLCEPIVCAALPPLENGLWRVTQDAGPGPALEGALAVHQCDEGYRLEGPFLRVCLRDGEWGGAQPTCKAIRCPVPDGRELGGVFRLVNRTNSVGSRALLRCKGGHVEGGSPYVTCTDDGTWTKPEAHCLFPERVSFEKREEARIENKGAIIFGMVVAAVMIVVVLVGIYLYGQRSHGVKPVLPGRSVQPDPPPRPPPRGKAFRTAIMGFMNLDGEDDPRSPWKQALVQVEAQSNGRESLEQNSPIPEQNSPMPEQNSPMHEQNSPVPEQNSPVPEQNSPIPVQNSPMSEQNEEEEDESEAEKKTTSTSSESEEE